MTDIKVLSYEEPAPKWEPGMRAHCTCTGIHQGEREFTVMAIDYRGDLKGDDGIVHMALHCRPIPPPKEEKPSQERQVMPNATRTDKWVSKDAVTGASPSGANETGLQAVIEENVGKREMRGGAIWECTGNVKHGLRWKVVLHPDEVQAAIDTKAHRAVETSEKPKNPFTGLHWYSINSGGYWENNALAQCIRDLADELKRIREEGR